MSLKWIAFDIGETLIDETRSWGLAADDLGVPRLTFFGVLGALIAEGRHHREVFRIFAPDLDVEAWIGERLAAGSAHLMRDSDLYPDARACLEALNAAGYFIALVGNQPRAVEEIIPSWGLPIDHLASSEGWGVAKPDPAFFTRLAMELGAPPGAIAYVGDRVDNDVLPAKAAGMTAVFLKRGPWGFVHAARPEAAQADLRLESLADLAPALAGLSRC
jgi:FMN phosphatase YigB (HAD superfamily)